ncbi:hypothetical protein FDP41_002699 [Naegleria fowleri]|uniref:Serpin domain-containing protein n=1 Tax=Naegleria fowleri TaxID=5763 RepID=A0A6A5BVA3_NAEFO|nr:uncharacterized protein FDP41_002699 [Naegleria fowleri]KAF0978184.1 hypothetical protein FDP41_002699 [Naegleria fowleri]
MCRFREQTKEETERINEFVSSKTNGLIKNLIPPNVITQSTCMVLVNAIYFLDKCRYDDSIRCGWCGVWWREFFIPLGFFALYKNEEFEMTIVMPRSHILVSTETEMEFDRWFVQQIFSASKDCSLSEIFSTFPTTLSELGIPKFKMDFSVMLSETLRRPPFNMKKCLAPGAEFSEMVHESSNLFISEVIHKAYIDVNEAGTEAAAATAVIMMDESDCADDEMERLTFVADRPFIYMLRHKSSGSILFIGKFNG